MFLLVRRLPDGDVELTTWRRASPDQPLAPSAAEVVRDGALLH